MLIEFNFKNFKSYKEKQALSMVSTGTKDPNLKENIIEASMKKTKGQEVVLPLLSSAVIYGPNASGKTVLIEAIEFVVKVVAAPRIGQSERKTTGFEVAPFLLSNDSRSAPSEFEVIFIHGGIRYQYGFILDSDKVHEEWLIAYPEGAPRTIFERVIKDASAEKPEYDWHFYRDKSRKNREDITAKTRFDALFLPVAVVFNDEYLQHIQEWFLHKLYWLYTKDVVPVHTLQKIDGNLQMKERVAHMLRNADLGIHDFRLEKYRFNPGQLPSDLPDSLRQQLIGTVRESTAIRVIMSHYTDEENVFVEFPLEQESLGTRRLFELSGLLLDVLDNGYILFVDELEASLHPLLVTKIIQLFSDDRINKKCAQLIFNTHNTALLSQDTFRRDQIWFVDKKRTGASTLYPLTDFHARSSEAFEPNYIHGRYASIPNLGKLVKAG